MGERQIKFSEYVKGQSKLLNFQKDNQGHMQWLNNDLVMMQWLNMHVVDEYAAVVNLVSMTLIVLLEI